MPKPRYEVKQITPGTAGVYDNRLKAFCSLDGQTELTWGHPAQAERWLEKCYRIWDFRPLMWDDPTPRETWGRPGRRVGGDRSPWDGYMTPVDDSRFGR